MQSPDSLLNCLLWVHAADNRIIADSSGEQDKLIGTRITKQWGRPNGPGPDPWGHGPSRVFVPSRGAFCAGAKSCTEIMAALSTLGSDIPSVCYSIQPNPCEHLRNKNLFGNSSDVLQC